MELLVVLLLILLNGVFALTEMAVVAARRARLQARVARGGKMAKRVLAVQAEPGPFLSTIQVGITSIAILSGAFGEAALAGPLAEWLSKLPALAPWREQIATALVVLGITYLSVVIGELVPKRLALLGPERVAMAVVQPINLLQRVAHPLVWLFSRSSDLVVMLLGARRADGPPISNDEIRALMAQGASAGVFHRDEHDLVANVLRLDEQTVTAILTPRSQMAVLDLADPPALQRQQMTSSSHTRVMVCEGGRENVIGFVHARDLLRQQIDELEWNVSAVLREPLYVLNSISLPRLFTLFRRRGAEFACVVDEYGVVEGMVTLSDLMEAIVGDLPVESRPRQSLMVRQGENSWQVEGTLTLPRFRDALGLSVLDEEIEGELYTVGGLAMHCIGRLPRVGETFECGSLHFEVLEMDRTRVAQLLVTQSPEAEED